MIALAQANKALACASNVSGSGLVEQPRSPRYNQTSGRATMRALAIATALALGGCASNISAYTRTDGVPVDPLHQQATLAQCKGEAALAPVQSVPGGPYGVVERERKEAAVVNSCMARNGYIQAKQ
jgi:hypothetical protein